MRIHGFGGAVLPVALIAIGMSAQPAPGEAIRYAVRDLGYLPGSTGTAVRGLNNNGQVLLRATNGGGGSFINDGGRIIPLTGWDDVSGINDSGQIAGLRTGSNERYYAINSQGQMVIPGSNYRGAIDTNGNRVEIGQAGVVGVYPTQINDSGAGRWMGNLETRRRVGARLHGLLLTPMPVPEPTVLAFTPFTFATALLRRVRVSNRRSTQS